MIQILGYCVIAVILTLSGKLILDYLDYGTLRFDTIRIVKETTGNNAFPYRYYLEKRYWWFPFWDFEGGTMTFSESEVRSYFANAIKAKHESNKKILDKA